MKFLLSICSSYCFHKHELQGQICLALYPLYPPPQGSDYFFLSSGFAETRYCLYEALELSEGLVKCNMLSPTPKASDSAGQVKDMRICISNMFSGPTDPEIIL